jgi:hypothetical protein
MLNRFMRRHSANGVSLLTLCFALVGTVQAQTRNYEEPDDAKPAWQESSVTLPAAPQSADLLPFYVSATASQRFMLDAKSLGITKEGVVRYTLLAKSEAGVQNVSYEGIRCDSFEYKTYAYGRADGSWSTSRRDQWQRILHNISNRAQAALALDFFCQGKTVAGKIPDILQKIRTEQVK